jgi:hypothetical protein
MSTQTTISREQEWRAIQARVRQLLAEHGRNDREGGDYHLVDQDLGTYEQKVLVFFKDALTPGLLEAVSDSLWDYSRDWRISFVEANKDGTEMIPPSGLKVSAYGPQPLLPPQISPEADRETQALYESLSQLLSRRGTSDAFGKGDYWIVDDGWVPRSHKVCVFNVQFLTPQLAQEVQRLLSQKFPECTVWFQIEVAEPGVDVPLPGIRVFADRIEHDWDLDKLRSIFKERFRW